MTDKPDFQKRLTPAEEVFARAVLTERSLGKAYTAAYTRSRAKPYSNAWAYTRGAELAERPHVAARIAELRDQAAREAVVSAAQVMREWADIAFADANELIAIQRRCCRHCYGRGGEYQWRDEREHVDALADALDHNAVRKRDRLPERPMPTTEGGFGFNPTKPPVVNCPRCHGEGEVHIRVADTTKLTGGAAKLYKGTKVGKDGQIEVLMRDQDAALANLAKAMGMFAGKDPDSARKDDPAEFLRELQKILPN